MTISAYPITPADAATVTADLYGLPTGRLTSRDTAAHAFVDTLDDLTTWLDACGGYTTRERAGGGVVLWTLRTSTEPRADHSHTPVYVHALALDEEQVPDELTAALT